MNISKEDFKNIFKKKSNQLRIDVLRATTAAKSGHPTSCFSAADIISVLFFSIMNYDYKNPLSHNNDRFIMSKGHAVPLVYAALKQLNVIDDATLLSLRSFNSPLEGHPTPRFIYNEAATGSLGQGLSIGAGMALYAKKHNLSYKTYVMLGDSEIAEGSIWEAADFAAFYKLNNVIAILDCNKFGQANSVMHAHDILHQKNKWEAFGWNTITIDGHDFDEIVQAFSKLDSVSKPTIIIAKTIKGYGLSLFQDNLNFHGKPLNNEQLALALKELNYNDKAIISAPLISKYSKNETTVSQTIKITDDDYHLINSMSSISTRKAYGMALETLGKMDKNIIVFDAEVKNSTFTELFEKSFPQRFVQCFVAEQNMIGVASGFALRGAISCAATFGTFFARAFDQLRMSAIGRVPLRLCGSHAGVAIGEDGPSQMALEDMALMRSLPHAIVLYPSDGVSTYKLLELSINYHDGISYLRTTRQDTPKIYDMNHEFKIGRCNVLRQSKNDQVCLIAAGITLHEALKAYEILKKENIEVSIIDLYSIKPLDKQTIIDVAKQSNNTIITIEDHYEAGGIGEAITAACINESFNISSLCVRDLPRSGSSQELLRHEKIDVDSIVKTVYNSIKKHHFQHCSSKNNYEL